jgi:hypothetical protein
MARGPAPQRPAPADKFAPLNTLWPHGGQESANPGFIRWIQSKGFVTSYSVPGYGYAPSYGYSGYNPGGLGGPWSGLGVRPGLGLGGFGLRR